VCQLFLHSSLTMTVIKSVIIILKIIMLCLFPTKMLVTVTLHFWQQNQTYITKKLGKNVAIKVFILGWQKMAKIQHFWRYFLIQNLRFLMNENLTLALKMSQLALHSKCRHRRWTFNLVLLVRSIIYRLHVQASPVARIPFHCTVPTTDIISQGHIKTAICAVV